MNFLLIAILTLTSSLMFSQEEIVLDKGDKLSFEVLGCNIDEIPKVSFKDQMISANCVKAYCYMEADWESDENIKFDRYDQGFNIYLFDKQGRRKLRLLKKLRIKYDTFLSTTKWSTERKEKEVLSNFIKSTDECQAGLVLQGTSGLGKGIRDVVVD